MDPCAVNVSLNAYENVCLGATYLLTLCLVWVPDCQEGSEILRVIPPALSHAPVAVRVCVSCVLKVSRITLLILKTFIAHCF